MLIPGIMPRLRSRPVAGSADKRYFCECAVDQLTPKKRLATALNRRPWTLVNERRDTSEWSSAVSVMRLESSRREGGGDSGTCTIRVGSMATK